MSMTTVRENQDNIILEVGRKVCGRSMNFAVINCSDKYAVIKGRGIDTNNYIFY